LAAILIAIVLGIICQYKLSALDEKAENDSKDYDEKSNNQQGEITILNYHKL